MLSQAGEELARLAIEEPGRYLDGLSLIRQLKMGEVEAEQIPAALGNLRRILWSALPTEISSPVVRTQTPHLLNERFLKQLEKVSEQ
jgi:hypothetical protein